MTIFIVKINHPLEQFELNNLPENRMDLVARCVNAALWLDHAIRKNVEIIFHFSNNKVVKVKGNEIRQMRPDERNIASFFKHMLNGKKYPGIFLEEMSFYDLLKKFKSELIFILDKQGKDLSNYSRGHLESDVFVLGDDLGLKEFPENEFAFKKLKIGPESYLTSHCISFLNIYLDGLND